MYWYESILATLLRGNNKLQKNERIFLIYRFLDMYKDGYSKSELWETIFFVYFSVFMSGVYEFYILKKFS